MRWLILAGILLGAAVALQDTSQRVTAQGGPFQAVLIRSVEDGEHSCYVYDSNWQPHQIPREHALWIAATHVGRLVLSTCIIDYTIDVAPGGYCLVQIDGATYWLPYKIDFPVFGETVITCNGRAKFVTT